MSQYSATDARNRAGQLAASDWRAAADLAGAIEEPWFRCQALAVVVCSVPSRIEQRVLLEASFASARSETEPNRIVSVSSWPVSAAYRLGFVEMGDLETERLLDSIADEHSPVRRADALELLLSAALGGPPDTFWRVYDAFLGACSSSLESGRRNRKGQGHLASWAATIARLDGQRGEELLNLITGPTLLARAVASIQKSQMDGGGHDVAAHVHPIIRLTLDNSELNGDIHDR